MKISAREMKTRVEPDGASQQRVGLTEDEGSRIGYLDALRGLASFQVLLSHASLAFFAHVALATPASGGLLGYLAATPVFFLIDGASAVCIFFVLSGYVLTPGFTYSPASPQAIIFSRFLRLGVAAVAACAFSAILFQVFSGYNVMAGAAFRSSWLAEGWRPSPDLWFLKDAVVNGVLLGFQDSSLLKWFGAPTSLLASPPDSFVTPLWTLSIEFYGSILVLFLARTRSWRLTILAAIVFSRSYLICFILGHAAARLDLGGKRSILPVWIAASFVALGIAVCVASHFWVPEIVARSCDTGLQILPPCPLGNASYLMRVYGATAFMLGVMQCGPIRTFLGRHRLSILGPLSFPIYLTHWPIIFGVGSFLGLLATRWVADLPARILAFAASLLLTMIAAHYFEAIDAFAQRISRYARRSAGPRTIVQ